MSIREFTPVQASNWGSRTRQSAGFLRIAAADAPLPDLVEVAEVGSFAGCMAQIDRSFDHLKLCRDAKWSVPLDHPDLVPTREALLLQEGLHEASRSIGDEYDQEFRSWVREADDCAQEILSALKDHDLDRANSRFKLLEQRCKVCHGKYRDP